jgi:hypothetical protein
MSMDDMGRRPHSSQAPEAASGRLRRLGDGKPLLSSGCRCHGMLGVKFRLRRASSQPCCAQLNVHANARPFGLAHRGVRRFRAEAIAKTWFGYDALRPCRIAFDLAAELVDESAQIVDGVDIRGSHRQLQERPLG